MRTHDSRVATDVTTEALAGHPATDVPAQQPPNVRVAPSPAAGTGPLAGTGTGTGRDAGGWDCGVGSDDDPSDGRDADGGAHEAARRPGRPRSERAEHAIIDATIEAIGECGIDGVRCEDVATRAGVGKATLYRRWPGKEDLLIAAFAAMRRPLPEPLGESVREDLIRLLTVVAQSGSKLLLTNHPVSSSL